MTDSDDPRAQANALLRQARELDDVSRLPVFDEIVARFGQSADVGVQERVAAALLRKGLALDRLERRDEELEAYDELLRRFSATTDQETTHHVAWAMYDKALALHNLDREEEAAAVYAALVDRFRGSEDPAIRPRVSWSMWWLYGLGKYAEEELCRALAERADDEVDPDLRAKVLFAYCTLGAVAHRNGDVDSALRLFDTILARAGDSTDADEQIQVANALFQKAYVLEQRGRYVDAVEVYDDLIPRLDGSSQSERAVDARRRRAIALDNAGRASEALDAYDDALALAAESSPAPLREQAFRVLSSKALTLQTLKRRAEALVVFNGVLQTYNELEPSSAASLRPTAIRALMEKVLLLCELDRSDEAGEVEAELVALLGDVAFSPRARPRARPADEEVAALLAEVHASDCWTLFEAPPRGATAQFDGMALELYRRTDPLLQTPIEDRPAVAAATIIRQVADGFALLSEPPGSTTLALPQRRLLEWAMRLAGVDEWAAEQGHPLDLAEDSEDIQELIDEQPQPENDYSDDSAAACVAAFYRRDMIAALCDSETGRQALDSSTLRWLSVRQLNTARSWGGWAFANGDDAQPATAVAILVAQAFYRASRESLSSSELMPSRETILELLRQADGTRWLEDRGLVLPDWLAVED
ncbi:MAG TPA: tetratricopeptide repeat protein [Gaiellaceae bacterium]|nr:tetratricopeptide repeat protein [Gaiellaceae bacterium]